MSYTVCQQPNQCNAQKCVIVFVLGAMSMFYFIYLLPDFSFNWNYIVRTSIQSGKRTSYHDLLDKIDVNCTKVLEGDRKAINKAKWWTYNTRSIEELLYFAEDRCGAIRKLFGFDAKNTSQEELNYPLAYGAVVYRNFVQVLFMLSAFYRPQNEYCMAVSGSAQWRFKLQMSYLGKCFNNVHVLQRPPIEWGSFEIINTTWVCVELLAKTKTKWMYYQQLSGVDAPLKTNLEMVKIFKALNNTVNTEFSTFQTERLQGKQLEKSPLPLFKSSLSAALPRKAIDEILKTNKGWELLHFLNGTHIADESFWTTLTGNVKKFPVPGGTDGEKWMNFREQFREDHEEEVENYTSSAQKNAWMTYYIARHQVWYENCGGEMVAGSCVYGVDDLPNLLKQPHLIAHKFYLETQPATFFCVLKEIRAREKKPLAIDQKLYSELPQVELSSGVPYNKLRHPLWMF